MSADENGTSEEENKSRKIFLFEKGHPRKKTHGHRNRKLYHWSHYSAKRLPDVELLNENSTMSTEELNAKREEYAQGALIMFYPFINLDGNGT